MALYGEQLVKNMAALEKRISSRLKRIEVIIILSTTFLIFTFISAIVLRGDLNWIRF